MRYGIEIGAVREYGHPRILAELARCAEDAGWDGVFLEDYIVYYDDSPTYDPWIALAAIALNTTHIRLGTSVTPLARRRPWKVARETVTLDHLSDGRFILGVGLGSANSTDFARFGEVTDDRRRAKQLDEALEVLVGLWSGSPFSYQGEYFQIHETTLEPTPMQQPRIPVWIGGGYPLKGPLRRAARWDGAIMYKHNTTNHPWLDMTPDDVRHLKATVSQERTGLPPYEIAIGGRERGLDWEQEREHIRAIAEAGATWWMEAIPPEELETIRKWIMRGPLRID